MIVPIVDRTMSQACCRAQGERLASPVLAAGQLGPIHPGLRHVSRPSSQLPIGPGTGIGKLEPLKAAMGNGEDQSMSMGSPGKQEELLSESGSESDQGESEEEDVSPQSLGAARTGAWAPGPGLGAALAQAGARERPGARRRHARARLAHLRRRRPFRLRAHALSPSPRAGRLLDLLVLLPQGQ